MRTTTPLGLVLSFLLLSPWLLPAPGCGGGDPDPAPTPTPAEDDGAATTTPADGAAGAVGEATSPAAGLSAPLTATVGQIPGDDRARTLPGGTDAAAGKVLYGGHCASCHGATGKGDGAAAGFLDPRPGDFTAAQRVAKTTSGEKAWLIANGVGGGSSMPGFAASLDEGQIWQLVAYLESMSQ